MTCRGWRWWAGGLVASALCVGTAAAGGAGVWARASAGETHTSRSTWIDSQAPRVFDTATPQLRGLQVRYGIDAKVLLPLGFVSLELWSQSDVGWIAASYRDCLDEDGAVLRGYELFSATRPERARGLNRLGFFREALRTTSGGVAWTAYFGAMTSSPEKTYGEAAKALNNQRNVYDVTDGVATPQEARAAMFRVGVETPAATASELYAILRPRLGEPRRTPSADSSPGRPLPPLAFLGALQAGLKRAAALAGRPANLAQARVEFVHNGSVRQLELLSLKRDPGRGRRLAGRGFVRNVNDVFTLEYRITSGRRTDGGFRMWVELPASGHDNADAPIVPLGWEFEMRSFLRLSAERTY